MLRGIVGYQFAAPSVKARHPNLNVRQDVDDGWFPSPTGDTMADFRAWNAALNALPTKTQAARQKIKADTSRQQQAAAFAAETQRQKLQADQAKDPLGLGEYAKDSVKIEEVDDFKPPLPPGKPPPGPPIPLGQQIGDDLPLAERMNEEAEMTRQNLERKQAEAATAQRALVARQNRTLEVAMSPSNRNIVRLQSAIDANPHADVRVKDKANKTLSRLKDNAARREKASAARQIQADQARQPEKKAPHIPPLALTKMTEGRRTEGAVYPGERPGDDSARRQRVEKQNKENDEIVESIHAQKAREAAKDLERKLIAQVAHRRQRATQALQEAITTYNGTKDASALKKAMMENNSSAGTKTYNKAYDLWRRAQTEGRPKDAVGDAGEWISERMAAIAVGITGVAGVVGGVIALTTALLWPVSAVESLIPGDDRGEEEEEEEEKEEEEEAAADAAIVAERVHALETEIAAMKDFYSRARLTAEENQRFLAELETLQREVEELRRAKEESPEPPEPTDQPTGWSVKPTRRRELATWILFACYVIVAVAILAFVGWSGRKAGRRK